ncbi:biopolymer transport protein ExbD [Sphingomonas sp. UYAg733]
MAARAIKYGPARSENTEPFSDLNITPLIDVLLVLLVMMILTIPIMTHKVPIDLPQPQPGPVETMAIHRIDLNANGSLTWDGAPITDAALPARLAGFMKEDNAQLQIRAAATARYERFDQTLAMIKRAGVTRLGFVGNEQFAKFGDL